MASRPDIKKQRFNVTVDAAANVCAFASKMGFWVAARSLTWVLHRLPLPVGAKDACPQSHAHVEVASRKRWGRRGKRRGRGRGSGRRGLRHS